MAGRCPGQDGRHLTVSLHICPTCGAEVEMFSDETRVKCRTCGAYVAKEEVPTCISWCSQARACIGEQRWAALMADPEEDEPERAGEQGGGDA